jgi:nucleotide-binding universal stress UspA family protein
MNARVRRTVVVGVDGSDEALRAVRFGAVEASRRRAPLRLVHAFGWVVERAVGQPALGERYRDLLLEQARRFVAVAAGVAAGEAPGIEVEQQVVIGFPIEVLADESRRAQLLVVGDRGLTRFEGLLAGSVSVALAAHGDCPVVVVRGAEPGDPEQVRPVVVGIDGTPTSEAAIAFAFEEASARRAPLVAVHTWGIPPAGDPTARAVAGTVAHEVLAQRLAGWTEKYPDVRVRRVVLQDRPVHALVREAHHGQLLVVGSRGRGRIPGMVLGSVAHALVHRAPCPVAVVRPEG